MLHGLRGRKEKDMRNPWRGIRPRKGRSRLPSSPAFFLLSPSPNA